MNDSIKAGGGIHAGDGGYSIGTQEKYDEFVKGRNESLGKARIRILLSQAGIHYEVLPKDNVYEKFALLIVKECVNVSLKSSHRYDDMGAIIASDIEEHFGVE
jgi:hypothetical protein